MAQYQNFFTQVQVRSTIYPGIPIQPGIWVRTSEGRFNYWLGKVGDAQVGPFYLGFLGLASIAFLSLRFCRLHPGREPLGGEHLVDRRSGSNDRKSRAIDHHFRRQGAAVVA